MREHGLVPGSLRRGNGCSVREGVALPGDAFVLIEVVESELRSTVSVGALRRSGRHYELRQAVLTRLSASDFGVLVTAPSV